MRRTFLFQIIAAFLAGGQRVFAWADMDAILGDWYLLGEKDKEVPAPQHRMDLRFKNSGGELKGAVLSRNDGSEIPLESCEFDGSTLRFKLKAPSGKTTEMSTMVLVRKGAKFEGSQLKLVRATK